MTPHLTCAGRYPFQEPADVKLPQAEQLQVMFPRIVSARFPRPAWLGLDCLDLLQRMMHVDPLQRLDVQGVLQHPWLREGACCAATGSPRLRMALSCAGQAVHSLAGCSQSYKPPDQPCQSKGKEETGTEPAASWRQACGCAWDLC